MILEREQINRYLRHIIIPEISGPGQKKLLQSTVAVFSDSTANSAPLLYYLAAAGIGNIYCSFYDYNGYEDLFANIQDLNSDVSINLIKNDDIDLLNYNCAIITGSCEFIANFKNMKAIKPLIFAVSNSWKGFFRTFNNQSDLDLSLSSIKNMILNSRNKSCKNAGSIFSSGFMGAVSAVETIKLCLNLGSTLDDLLYFDLFNMNFEKVNYEQQKLFIDKLLDNSILTELTSNNYKVLIVGTGGLGSPSAYALAAAGINTLGLIDYDLVDISNLNRQILHSSSRIGIPKVESAKIFLKKLNPNVNIVTYQTSITKDNALEIISNYDVVIDAVDNFPARYLINDACKFAGKPMIEAGVIRFDGLGMTIIPGAGPCYRCIYPNIPAPGSIPSCSESGVLGPIPGILGFIQAAEAYKLLYKIGQPLVNRMIFIDGLDMDFMVLNTKRKHNCSLCGDNPSINTFQEYEFRCESKVQENLISS